jgi:hypothetical protein
MTWALVLIVPAAFGATARPAEPIVPTGTVIKLLLLRQKSVQQELKLSPEVVQKINEFTTAESEAAGKLAGKDEAELKEAYAQLTKKNDQFLADNLSAEQNKRLNQITMQFAALTVLTRPETAKGLNLSDEQVQKLKDLQTQARKDLVELLATKEGRTEKFKKLREETRTKILEVLTDDQKAKVREMAGPPFEGEIVFEEPD